VSHHKCVQGENRGRNGRGSVNREERADCGELAADFFFLDIEETSNVLDHLLMREGQFITGRTVRRGRSNHIGGVASTIDGRGQARRNEDGGG